MKKLFYHIGKLNDEEQLKLDMEDTLSRTAEERIELGFIPMSMPIIDEVPYRIFDSMDEYRRWAAEELPPWLGYKR
jgi:hypothetical protein